MSGSGIDAVGIYYTYSKGIEVVLWDYYTGDKVCTSDIRISDICLHSDVETLFLKPIRNPDRELVFDTVNCDYSNHSFDFSSPLPGLKVYELLGEYLSEATVVKSNHSLGNLIDISYQKSLLVNKLLTSEISEVSDNMIVKRLIDEVCLSEQLCWKNVVKILGELALLHSLPFVSPEYRNIVDCEKLELTHDRVAISTSNPDFSCFSSGELNYLREYIQSLVDIGDSSYINLLTLLENHMATI